MKSKDLDIVYFVKDAPVNEELKYSLRSVCENLQFNRLWIFGGCPKEITPDVRIRVVQTGRTKWDRVRRMFIKACENKDLTDDFILFNDDFFVMQKTDEIPTWYRATLDDHIKVLAKGNYANLLKCARKNLEVRKKTTLSYELHVPFVFNKKKLLKLIRETPELHCTRTLYGNMYKIGGEKHNDVKIFNSKPAFDYKNSQFLSTDDTVVNINNDAWRFIKKSFPNKCKYES